MIRFEDVERKIERHHPDADLELLRRAYIFSAMKHKDQVRASGEPYLVHPLSVAEILAAARAADGKSGAAPKPAPASEPEGETGVESAAPVAATAKPAAAKPAS